MCRSNIDPCGARRCKTSAEESAAKANYRSRQKLKAQYESQVSPGRKPAAAETVEVAAVEETYEDRVSRVLAVINGSDEQQIPPLTVAQKAAKLTAAYVELGQMIAEKALPDEEADRVMSEVREERRAREDRIVKLSSEIKKMKSEAEALPEGEERDELESKISELGRKAEEVLANSRKKDEKLERFFVERAESYREELKRFGVEFAENEEIVYEQGSNRDAVKNVNSVLQYFPKEWVEKSNELNPMIVKSSTGRSHYIEATLESRRARVQEVKYLTKPEGWQPNMDDFREKDYIQIPADEFGDATYTHPETGKQMTVSLNDATETAWAVPQYEYYRGEGEPSSGKWEKVERVDSDGSTVVKWRKPSKKLAEVEVVSAPKLVIPKDNSAKDRLVYGVTDTQSVSLHELTHRMEHANPALKNAEKNFVWYRAKLGTEDAEELVEISGGEYGYQDNFANHYMGRDYEGEFYEIASVGFESLWFGKDGGHESNSGRSADREYRNFLLGVLASTAKR